VSVTLWKLLEGDGSSLSHVRHTQCASHDVLQHMAAVLPIGSVRCPNAAQCVLIKDVLQLIKSHIFGEGVLYSDDIREMMLLACLAERHRDLVHPNLDPNTIA
jgi:hypothetical protein